MLALTGEHRHDASLAAQMDELLEAGKRHQAAKLFFEVATNTENVENLKMWPDCVDLAETIARESRAVEQYRLKDTLDFHAPTLLLMSGNGPRNLRDGVQTLHDALGDSRLVELTGIGHGGISTNPTQVAVEVQEFISKLAE